jgi:hypothetical protein
MTNKGGFIVDAGTLSTIVVLVVAVGGFVLWSANLIIDDAVGQHQSKPKHFGSSAQEDVQEINEALGVLQTKVKGNYQLAVETRDHLKESDARLADDIKGLKTGQANIQELLLKLSLGLSRQP